MKTPLVSIITVVYNGEKFLEKTIQSVINQNYKNIEYIVIDGGSTDKTVDIIKKYEKHIAYWVSERDDGIYDAMNKGMDQASGDFVNFMNAGDSFYDSNVLKTIFEDFGDCIDKTIFGKAISRYNKHTFIRYENFDLENSEWYQYRQPSHQAIFYPKCFYQNNSYDTRLKIAADVVFTQKALALGHCYHNIVIADFEFGGISTYFGSWKNFMSVINDISVIYKNNKFIKYKSYFLNGSKYLIQRMLGERVYLNFYTLYLTKFYKK